MIVDKVNKAEVAREMEQLLNFGPFRRLMQLWAMKEESILRENMKRPSSEGWDELRGFRIAIEEPNRWLRHLEEKKEKDYAHPTGGE